MFRIVSFAIVLLCGNALGFMAEDVGSRVAGGLIGASAAAGLLWAFRDYRKKDDSKKADKRPASSAGIAFLQIVSSAGITVAGVGTAFVAVDGWLTIIGWIMAVSGAAATLLALKAYRDHPHS